MIEIVFTIEDSLGYVPCGARLGGSRGGPVEFCRRRPVQGKKRCELHGGKKTARTLADRVQAARKRAGLSPGMQPHVRFDKLPPRLADRLKRAEDDPQLLSYRRDIELLEARIVELVGRLSTGESGAGWAAAGKHWLAVQAAFSEMHSAMVAKDADKLRDTLGTMTALISAPTAPLTKTLIEGNQDEQTWQDVADAAERKARIIDRENKRIVDLQQVMTVDQAMMLIAGLLSAVNKHVETPEIRRAIGIEFATLANFTQPRAPAVIQAAAAKVDELREAKQLERALAREARLNRARDAERIKAARAAKAARENAENERRNSIAVIPTIEGQLREMAIDEDRPRAG